MSYKPLISSLSLIFGIITTLYSQNKTLENLALFRNATTSSIDHAPTQPEFAVDGEDDTGWRARPEGVPQWLSVDLQVSCKISEIIIFSEANQETQIPDLNNQFVRGGTLGNEIFSSYPTSFKVELSDNGVVWKHIFENQKSQGGEVRIKLEEPRNARFVRIFITHASNSLPVGINELKVFGECISPRPETLGWTKRRKAKIEPNNTLIDNTKGELTFNKGWELTRSGWNGAENGRDISLPDFDTRAWYNATVPGTVVTTLVDQQVFSDPVIGLNNLKIPESLCRHNWWYRYKFKFPDKYIEEGTFVFFEIEGINQHAKVWMNGYYVGNILSAFLPGKFEISPFLNKNGENAIAIEICPMSTPGVPGEKGADGNVWVQSGKVALDGVTYNCSSGWDWMPAMRDRGIGILGSVYLKKTGAIRIINPYITTDLPLPDTSKVAISFSGTLENLSDKYKEGNVTISFNKRNISQAFKLKAGEKQTITFSPDHYKDLIVKNPILWWPNGYGQQNLYNLEMTVKSENKVSDSQNMRFGIREISYNVDSMSKTRRGQTDFNLTNARYVRINCLESLTDHFSIFDFCVYNTSDLSKDLAAFKPVKASSVAGGEKASSSNDQFAVSKWVSASENNQLITVDLGENYFINRVIAGWDYNGLATTYTVETSLDSIHWENVASINQEATPQLVIKVNGIPIFCRGGNWGLFDIALKMPKERMKQAVRFHKELGFTMIRNWMGNTMIPDFFNYCDEFGILVMNDFWAEHPNNVEAYIEVARENIKRFRNHPSLALWCGANESYPPPKIDEGLKKALHELDPKSLYLSHSADDMVAGFGPYFYTEPKNYYAMARGFKTEIGLASMPVYETALKMVGDKPVWPINETWFYHDYPAGSQTMKDYLNSMELRLGKISDVEDYCKKAQFINYENLRAIFEAWNHKLWNDCSAVLLWMTHPAWYSTVWQLYDYDFEIGGAWAGSKKACEPVHIQASLTDWKVDVINYTSRPLKNYKAMAMVFNSSGQQIGNSQIKVITVNASDKTYAFNINYPQNEDSLYFVKLELTDTKGNLISDNFYWKYEKPENLRKLYEIDKSQISGASEWNKKEGYIYLNLKNTGTSFGAMLTVSVLEETSKQRILPSYYSDNYFWMLSGEEKAIKIGLPENFHGTPCVKLTGINQEEVIIYNNQSK